MDDARNSLQMISREKTVIIVVDELDRCIPSYAIKVLERVHHLFDGIKNVVVIIAVDSQQLECSVKEIYGQAVIAKDYLKKIIDMTFKLNSGDLQQGIFDKYTSYFSKFIDPTTEELEKIEEVFVNIWSGIDMRTQEKLMEKAETIHSVITERKLSISLALFEIMVVRFQNTYTRKNLHWIPEINKGKYPRLDELISSNTEEYLINLNKQVLDGQMLSSGMKPRNILRENMIGRVFLIFDKIYSRDNIYYMQDENELDADVRVAEQFRTLADILE